jgi:small subunit ribosomal protein S5
VVKAKRTQQRSEKELLRRSVLVRRVAKVVKGGKRFRFSALVVVGDGKGSVGYGSGKAHEAPDAVRKATDQATKAMLRIPLKEGRTIYHDVTGCAGAGRVHLRSAQKGTGLIAGGAMRSLFEVLGVQDVVAKILGSTNPYNVILATLEALRSIETPRSVAHKRGKKVSELFAGEAA